VKRFNQAFDDRIAFNVEWFGQGGRVERNIIAPLKAAGL
jgi:hypothetical protein